MGEDHQGAENPAVEDILDELGFFEPAETVFEGATAAPPVAAKADTPDLRSALAALEALEASGGAEVAEAAAQLRAAVGPIAEEATSTPVPKPTAGPGGPVELEGEFESIADVLEGVFAHAAIVAEAADRAGVRAGAETATPVETPEAEPIVEVTVVADDGAAADAVADDAVEADDVVAAAAAEVIVVTDDAPAEDEGQEVDAILSSLGIDAGEPAGEPEDEPVAAGAKPEIATPVPAAGVYAERLRRIAAVLVPLVYLALVALSRPLQFLPPRLRPAVDWLALTLLFWVPVVWLVAWMK